MISAVDFIIFNALVVVSAFLSADKAEAIIYLVNATNHTIDSCYDLPASFSAKVSSEGLWGHHVFSIPADGCDPLVSPPSGKTWFAVIHRTPKCHNIKRALHAQVAGFKAVILYRNTSAALSDKEEMTQRAVTKVKIPVSEVEASCVATLMQYEKDLSTFTVLYGNTSENIWLFLVVGVSGILIVILCSGLMAWLFHNCCGKKKSIGLLSRWKLMKLKVHTYQTGDVFEACAICIEDYQVGDRLRILPCAHAFHCNCVDVWLTENRKTCPLCNNAADAGRKRTHRRNTRVNEDDDDERTPLLDDDRLPDDRTDGNRHVTADGGQIVSANNALPSVFVRHPSDRLRGVDIERSFVDVHEAPSDQPQNYGSISTRAPDRLTGLDRDDCPPAFHSLSASSVATQDSALLGGSSGPTKFYIGSPRDGEASSGVEVSSSQEDKRSQAVSNRETGERMTC